MRKRMVRPAQQVRKQRFSKQNHLEEFSSIPGTHFTLKRASASTDASKVRQDIAADIARGEGAMTAREAGHMRSSRS